MKLDNLNKKLIVENSIEIYLDDAGKFNLNSVAKKLKVKRTEIYKFFKTKNQILSYFYQNAFENYKELTKKIENYENFNLEEKLGNLIYTHLEIFQNEKEFVDETFDKIIFNSNSKTNFQKSLEEQVSDILKDSEGDISMINSKIISNFIVKEVFYLIKFWLKDESENYEETMELTDKILSFASEILMNQIVSKGIILLKTLIEKNIFKLGNSNINFIIKNIIKKLG